MFSRISSGLFNRKAMLSRMGTRLKATYSIPCVDSEADSWNEHSLVGLGMQKFEQSCADRNDFEEGTVNDIVGSVNVANDEHE